MAATIANQGRASSRGAVFTPGLFYERIVAMQIEALRVGMKVRHPQYGVGVVKSIGPHSAEVRVDDELRTLAPETAGLEPAEPQAAVTALNLPLSQLIQDTVRALAHELNVEQPDAVVEGLAARWQGGRLVLHPADPGLQTKEVPVEVFFHKIVGMRNQLRVLEQKLNAHEKLSDAEKVEMQQYITRCYGSMTTFNVLFKEKEDQF